MGKRKKKRRKQRAALAVLMKNEGHPSITRWTCQAFLVSSTGRWKGRNPRQRRLSFRSLILVRLRELFFFSPPPSESLTSSLISSPLSVRTGLSQVKPSYLGLMIFSNDSARGGKRELVLLLCLSPRPPFVWKHGAIVISSAAAVYASCVAFSF